jgi:amino acid transporter
MDNRNVSSKVLNNSKIRERDVKLYAMVFMIYSFCASGAFGVEEMISSAGPGLTLALLLILPICWAAPQALVAAELGSAMPYTGGFYKWIQRGLGEFWAFQAGWCRSLAQYVENSIYIILAANYLAILVPMTEGQAYMVKAAFILFFTFVNLRGIREVSFVSTILSIIVLMAFTFITVVGFKNWSLNPFVPFYNSDEGFLLSLSGALAIGMWMFSGYASVSTLAGDCKDKSVVYKGLLFGLPFIAITYFFPTLTGIASVGDWQNWAADGISFGTVANLAGPGFQTAFVVVAVIANLSIFNTCMISLSRGFYAIAEDNLAPKFIVKVSEKTGVPYIAVISVAVVALIGCRFDFSVIVVIAVTLMMVDYVLIWIAGIVLRIKEPEMKRPFKIPVGTKGFVAIVTPGILIAIIALMINGSDYFLGGLAGVIIVPLLYVGFKIYYGGLTKLDAVSYPINPKTKLGFGDLRRIATIFGIFAVLGSVACKFLPWYEGGWGPEYYQETYGFEGAYDFIIRGIQYMTISLWGLAILLLIASFILEKNNQTE